MQRVIVHGAAMVVVGLVAAFFGYGFAALLLLSAGVLYVVLPDFGPDRTEPVRRLDYLLGAGAVLLVLVTGIALP